MHSFGQAWSQEIAVLPLRWRTRSPRDGRIEKIGHYNPLRDPVEIAVDEEGPILAQGRAKASGTARSILVKAGVWSKFEESAKAGQLRHAGLLPPGRGHREAARDCKRCRERHRGAR